MVNNTINPFQLFQNNLFPRNQGQRPIIKKEQEIVPYVEEQKEQEILPNIEEKQIIPSVELEKKQEILPIVEVQKKPLIIDKEMLKKIQENYNIGENGRDLKQDSNNTEKKQRTAVNNNNSNNNNSNNYNKNIANNNNINNRNTNFEHKIKPVEIEKVEALKKQETKPQAFKPQEFKPQEFMPKQSNTLDLIDEEEHIENLDILIQNARNTKIFYENLYELSGQRNLQIINELIEITDSIKTLLHELFIEQHAYDYETIKMPINTNMTYKKALKWALHEEIIALKEFNIIYENLTIQKLKNKINTILIYKVCVINLLQMV